MEYDNDIHQKYSRVVGVGACLFNLVWLAAICLTILAVALTYYLYRYGNLVRILHSHEQKRD